MGILKIKSYCIMYKLLLIASAYGQPCTGCGHPICEMGELETCTTCEAEGGGSSSYYYYRRGAQASYNPTTCEGTWGCYGKLSTCSGTPGSGSPVYASWRREALKESDEFVSMDDYELVVGNLEECADGTNCYG